MQRLARYSGTLPWVLRLEPLSGVHLWSTRMTSTSALPRWANVREQQGISSSWMSRQERSSMISSLCRKDAWEWGYGVHPHSMQTLENSISGILSKVRQQAGQYCIDTLSRNNAPLIMAKSGSKGSDINVAQMVAVVGQQIIGGQRVPDLGSHRSRLVRSPDDWHPARPGSRAVPDP